MRTVALRCRKCGGLVDVCPDGREWYAACTVCTWRTPNLKTRAAAQALVFASGRSMGWR